MKKIIPFVLCLLFISGCDPINNHSQIISNQSKYELVIVKYNKGYSNIPPQKTDSVIIKSMAEGVIKKYSSLGGAETTGCAGTLADSLVGYVKNNPAQVVKKNLNDAYNWIYARTKKNNKSTSECKVVIADNDI